MEVAHCTNSGNRHTLTSARKHHPAATRNMYLDSTGPGGQKMPSRLTQLASGVPGSVAGMWEAHQRYGSLPWGHAAATCC